MKAIYTTPQVEVVEIEIEALMLNSSPLSEDKCVMNAISNGGSAW